jgi:predicted amidophosphoribosyltransferase
MCLKKDILKKFFLDLIFPRYCLGCQKELSLKQTSLICEVCFDKIVLNRGVQCHICGLRNNRGTCRKCLPKTRLKGLYAAGFYQDPILKEMIHHFKYKSIESLKKLLAELIIAYITKELLTDKLKNSILVPIPLTLKRKINRGFNQSELLAKEIGKFLNCPVINLLKRKKFTSPQAEISDWQKRKENISGAFCLSTSYPHFYRFRKPINYYSNKNSENSEKLKSFIKLLSL